MRKKAIQLNKWYSLYHKPEYLIMDPLVCIRKLNGNANREIGALIASVISYGRVEIIIKNCLSLFSLMEWQPADFIYSTKSRDYQKIFGGFKHRFTGAEDIILLLKVLAVIIKENGSIENFFIEGSGSSSSFKDVIGSFCKRVKKIANENVLCSGKGFDYLFPSPESGSACKRINMFLRWVTRENDGIDLGIWNGVKPSQLIMPVDTHVAEQSRILGLTERNVADWKMAEEITDHLRRIDPNDPIRFDFSLCRAGMIKNDKKTVKKTFL
jgi:uncharacterized protein (TIGR02757 family)